MQALATRTPDIYQWRAGSPFRLDATLVGKHLEHLAELSGGHLTTDTIANEAQIPTSPIYNLFEHDMETAALEYQRTQARQIVNSLVIVTIIPAERKEQREFQPNFITIDVAIEEEEEPVQARAFPNVIINGERFYTPLQAVLKDGSLRDQYQMRLLHEVKAMARKIADFKVFSSVVQAIESLPEELPEAV
jgi:hypothetical protein